MFSLSRVGGGGGVRLAIFSRKLFHDIVTKLEKGRSKN